MSRTEKTRALAVVPDEPDDVVLSTLFPRVKFVQPMPHGKQGQLGYTIDGQLVFGGVQLGCATCGSDYRGVVEEFFIVHRLTFAAIIFYLDLHYPEHGLTTKHLHSHLSSAHVPIEFQRRAQILFEAAEVQNVNLHRDVAKFSTDAFSMDYLLEEANNAVWRGDLKVKSIKELIALREHVAVTRGNGGGPTDDAYLRRYAFYTNESFRLIERNELEARDAASWISQRMSMDSEVRSQVGAPLLDVIPARSIVKIVEPEEDEPVVVSVSVAENVDSGDQSTRSLVVSDQATNHTHTNAAVSRRIILGPDPEGDG